MSCEFVVEKEGGFFQCEREGDKIARCSNLCATHFSMIVRDNRRRIEQGIDIPNNFKTIIKVHPIVLRICTKRIDKLKDKEIIDEENVNEGIECVVSEEDLQQDK